MRYLLVLCIYAVGSVFAMISPALASCLYLWSNIFQPLSFAKHDGALPVAIYVVVILLLSIVVTLFRGKSIPRLNAFILCVPLFMIWSLICALRSPYAAAIENYVTILKYIAPLLFISATVQSFEDIEKVAAMWMASVGIWSSQGGVKGIVSGVTNTMNIPGGQMADNNDFMVGTVAAIPLMAYFVLNYKGPFRVPVRIVCAIMFLLSITAVVFSNSRGATVGLAALLLFYLTLLSRKKVRDFLIVGVLVGIAFYFIPETYYERLSTIEVGVDQTESSAANRMALMTAAFHASQDNPIFGFGPGCWITASYAYITDGLEPHDLWVKCSVENGFVGLGFYLLIIIVVLIQMYRARKRRSKGEAPQATNLATAIMAGIVGFCAAGTFTSHPYSEYLFALMGLGASLAKTLSAPEKKGPGLKAPGLKSSQAGPPPSHAA